MDSTNVYWAAAYGKAIVMVPIDGGAPTTLATGLDNPGYVAVDATHVYWTNAGTWGAGGYNDRSGSVMRVPIGGGCAETLVSGQSYPAGIAVNATAVYWANYLGGTLMMLPK